MVAVSLYTLISNPERFHLMWVMCFVASSGADFSGLLSLIYKVRHQNVKLSKVLSSSKGVILAELSQDVTRVEKLLGWFHLMLKRV